MTNSHNIPPARNRGFVALVTVLIAMAVAITIGASIVLKSVAGTNISMAQQASNQAWAAANGCAEYGLGLLAVPPATTTWFGYNSLISIPLSIGGNSCTITIIGSSTNILTQGKMMDAISTVSGFTSKIQTYVSTNTPAIGIVYWDEVANFTAIRNPPTQP